VSEALATVEKRAPSFAFFFLHAATVWPVGVVGLALAASLTRAGVPVREAAAIVAAASLGFTLEVVWAPLVDAVLTRRAWYGIGAALMTVALLTMFFVPWSAAAIPALAVLAFASCSGAAIAAVSVKGLMAYDVEVARMPAASAAYAAGGVAGKAVAGSLAILILAHIASRPEAGLLCLAPMAFAASVIALAAPRPPAPAPEVIGKLRGALVELWRFVATPRGMVTAMMCALPFAAGTEAGLMGAIAHEWGVTSGQLAVIASLGAAANIAGALASGALARRFGAFPIYLACGLGMMATMTAFAFAPRLPAVFFAAELFYRALATGGYAALLAMVMTAVGKGAASTKAAAMWSLTNFTAFYATLIEGQVHDGAGIRAMLLTDVAMAGAALALLTIAFRVLRPGPWRTRLGIDAARTSPG